MSDRTPAKWTALFLLSGAVSLSYEVVWMRRLGLVLGGSGVAAAVTVGAFMGGLALGSLIAPHLRGSTRRTYALLETAAALWALAFPFLLTAGQGLADPTATRWLLALLLLLPPTTALGATWPLLAGKVGPDLATRLYAANTTGAVLGVLGTAFVAIPMLGVRGTESLAALGGLTAAVGAWHLLDDTSPAPDPTPPSRPPWQVLAAASLAGFAAMGLEVAWFRLATVAMGGSVQVHAVVLATFLAMVAGGALLGRRWPVRPDRGLYGAMLALAALAMGGAWAWSRVPYLVADLYRWGGPEVMLPGTLLIAVVTMGGAPLASGVAFTCAVRSLGDHLTDAAGPLYAGNTVGGIIGAWLCGLWALPALGLDGATSLFAGAAALGAVFVAHHPARIALALGAAALLSRPLPLDEHLLAVGIHLRISDFEDPSHAAIDRFAHQGWELLSYRQGLTGAVAVGRSTATGNVWLSVNGKVDASTGDDMPTQLLSGTLPVRLAPGAQDVLVVGLASGVTAGAVLAEEGVTSLTIVELEPEIVAASHFFDHANGRPLDDPRTTLVIDDARAFLLRDGPRYDVIVSEPSNPWISGVSNLFTDAYWRAARARLSPDGVMCQWVQLYGLGPDQLRALVRTFQDVFPETYLFETIPGSDALLIGGAPRFGDSLPLGPTLDPQGLRRLGDVGWRNTDDRPRVEWEAPKWLHYATGIANAEAIDAARE